MFNPLLEFINPCVMGFEDIPPLSSKGTRSIQGGIKINSKAFWISTLKPPFSKNTEGFSRRRLRKRGRRKWERGVASENMENRRGLNDCAKKEGLCPLQKMLASFLKKNHSKNNSGKG